MKDYYYFFGNKKLKLNQNNAAPKVVKKLPDGIRGIKEITTNKIPQSLILSFSFKYDLIE